MATRRDITAADGTRLAVFESGTDDPSAPVVLAVHGYPDSHLVWDGVADLLGERFRVVRYDVRGAGESDRPPDKAAYRMQHLVDDLVAVREAITAEGPVHLLGHDWGSIQCWAALSDDRLRGRFAGFTSISGPSLEHAGRWLQNLHRHPLAAVRQLAHSYYIGLFQVPGAAELAIRTGLLARLIALGDARGRSALAVPAATARSSADSVDGLKLYRANLRGLPRTDPRRIEVPVQVLAPRSDPYVTPELALQAPEPFVADLRARTIAGGHWVVSERPDVVARLVTEFADDLAGGSGRPARPQRLGPFGGRLVVITGGGRGIGRATALQFAHHGADVLIADIDDAAASATVDALHALGATAAAYHLDVSDGAGWEQFAAQVRAEHGVPDIVVNNAGIGMSGPVLGTGVEDWQRILGVNLWGVIHGSRLFGRQLVERGEGGHIVNVASAAAYAPSKTLPAYSTTKAAVLMLTECLRAELAPDGIGVTAVCPGFVDSDITSSTVYVGVDEVTQQRLRDHAVTAYHRRNYPPERVARHIVRAVQRDTPVATPSVESRVLRGMSRFAPALGRRLAKVDLNTL